MLAPTIMVQGTSSSVGKSLIATALCRIFQQQGLRVAPFKSQNMALNSYVTPDGFEIGRAQAVQADAAKVVCSRDMNPILLKPEGDANSQVVVLGKPIGTMTAVQYHAYKPELRSIVLQSLQRLREQYDIVVIEGAGSPAEINLRQMDLVNMFVANSVQAPVLLVGDIDRGGVFASLVGTLELLEPEDRKKIVAFVINKFRGDISLLQSGLDFLTNRTQVPVLGVVPYVSRLRIADEDCVSLEDRRRRGGIVPADHLDIAVIRFPRISNHDDFEPLEHENGVSVRFIEHPDEIAQADLVILPGSKRTVHDLKWLRQCGFGEKIYDRLKEGRPVLGICGGCQMLGTQIEDPNGIESKEPPTIGLGLLPLKTIFGREKRTSQAKAQVKTSSFLTEHCLSEVISGYEIHMGIVEKLSDGPSPFQIVFRNGLDESMSDGAVSENGRVVGTMLHGIFENDSLRASLLKTLMQLRGIEAPIGGAVISSKEAEYDRLAAAVSHSIDFQLLSRLVGIPLRAQR